MINREYERRHLVPRDQIRGKTDFDIHPHDVAEAVRANDRQVIEAGIPIQFEESVPPAEGERHYISSKFLLRDRTGKPYAVCGIATDITELKRAEETQRRRVRQAALQADVQLAFSDSSESGLQTALRRSAEAIDSGSASLLFGPRHPGARVVTPGLRRATYRFAVRPDCGQSSGR